MRLYFKPADLLLEKTSEGDYILKVGDKVLGTFKWPKRALAEYNRVRSELDQKLPLHEPSDEEKRKMLASHIADNLVRHNSIRTPKKKPAKSRTFR